TLTFDSGGYSLHLNPGTYTVTFAGGPLAAPIVRTVTVGTANYRLSITSDASSSPSGPSSTAGNWVAALYQDLLGRTAMQPEVNAWVTAMQNGLSQDGVVRIFLGTSEYRQREVAQLMPPLYQGFLGRGPAAGELAIWSAVASAGWSNDDLTVAIAASGEAN